MVFIQDVDKRRMNEFLNELAGTEMSNMSLKDY